jgi:hypothetical protein
MGTEVKVMAKTGRDKKRKGSGRVWRVVIGIILAVIMIGSAIAALIQL